MRWVLVRVLNSYLILSLGPVANQPEAKYYRQTRQYSYVPRFQQPPGSTGSVLLCLRESLERIWLKTANQTSLSCKLSSNDGASRARLTSLDVHSLFPSAIAACPQTLKPSRASPLAPPVVPVPEQSSNAE